MLYVASEDVVIWPHQRDTKVVLFAFIPFGEDAADVFFTQVAPKAISAGAGIVVRPKTLTEQTWQLFALAACLPEDRRYVFLRAAASKSRSWEKARSVHSYLRPELDKAGLKQSEIASCLGNTKLREEMVTRQKIAEGRLFRPVPMPNLHLYLNEHYFPGLVDEPVLTETLLRAIRKANGRPRAVSAIAEALAPTVGEITIGDPAAPLHIVRYDTPEFPAAGIFFNDVFPHLKSNYIDTGKVRFTLRPYTWFQNGNEVAAAVLCASDDPIVQFRLFALAAATSKHWQSASGFWNYRRDGLTMLLKEAQKELHIDPARVLACASGSDARRMLSLLKETANETFDYFYSPTTFIGTTEHLINYNWPALRAVIDKELSRIEHGVVSDEPSAR
ncbi:hypothetical protein BOQ54_03270 [Chelatococcus daeguensis]|uniref:Thioredoxin-like fold domain-containing protein n=1 Tax=Chelatococcus daeguensis TaxID=444444 RepID=A0AAC9NXM7_9HYPH|nr:hypothetical protein BOQ54_03270 [Chelatococcus daeguensis]